MRWSISSGKDSTKKWTESARLSRLAGKPRSENYFMTSMMRSSSSNSSKVRGVCSIPLFINWYWNLLKKRPDIYEPQWLSSHAFWKRVGRTEMPLTFLRHFQAGLLIKLRRDAIGKNFPVDKCGDYFPSQFCVLIHALWNISVVWCKVKMK